LLVGRLVADFDPTEQVVFGLHIQDLPQGAGPGQPGTPPCGVVAECLGSKADVLPRSSGRCELFPARRAVVGADFGYEDDEERSSTGLGLLAAQGFAIDFWLQLGKCPREGPCEDGSVIAPDHDEAPGPQHAMVRSGCSSLKDEVKLCVGWGRADQRCRAAAVEDAI